MSPRNKFTSKRPIPSHLVLNRRRDNLEKLEGCEPNLLFQDAPLLEPGNSKTGKESKIYQRVLVWNIPAVKTCPGASSWCKSHCYNGDDILVKYPSQEWAKNYAYYLNDADGLKRKLISMLQMYEDKIAVRIHSSGDFFSVEYIDFWYSIVKTAQNANFWAYTRSWSIPYLYPNLEKLRNLENIQLFASWDKTMPAPPITWRKSVVYLPEDEVEFNGIACPEQSGLLPNCATCDYCIAKTKGDVYFILH